MLFANQQIHLEDLPQAEHVEFQRLAPAYRKVSLLGTAAFFAFLFIPWLAFFLLGSIQFLWLKWIALAVWAAWFALSLYISNRRYLVEGYALREHDMLHRSGIFWHSETVIPFNRMQHCEISRGPIENAFGLATLRAFTAGGSSSDLEIGGLLHGEALRIKEFITHKIREAGAVES